MRIGIVCYPTIGGSGVLATELGHQLAQRGHEIHFITYAIPFRLRLEERNIYFHEVILNQYDLFPNPDYALTLAVKIAEIAVSNRLDLIHAHYAIPHATSAYLAKKISKDKFKVITTLHGTDITLVGSDSSFKSIVKFSIENSDGITCVSKDLKKKTKAFFDLKNPIEVIYNFFIPKPELTNQKPFQKDFAPNGEKLLIHASNFRPVKRPMDVLRIFCKLREKIKCRLILAGGGNGINEIRKMVEEKRWCNEVIFLGENREIDPFIASSDLLLLPSEQESFGLVALEAMAYGVPVIGSCAGGITEVIENGVNGFLEPVGSIEKMANDALHLLKDKKLYQEFSENAKKRAENCFSAPKIVTQYESYYQKVLDLR